MNSTCRPDMDLLRQHGLLPVTPGRGEPRRTDLNPDQLLLSLRDAWHTALSDRLPLPQRQRIRRRIARIERLLQRNGALTWGWPGPNGDLFSAWVGQRLIWWPRGVPPGERISLVSSRLGRRLEKRRSWFRLLRTVCQSLEPGRHVLVSAAGTAAAPFLDRCCDLFQVPLLEFCPVRSPKVLVARWLDDCLTASPPNASSTTFRWPACVSPLLGSGECVQWPLQDRLVVAAADTIVAGRVRAGGHVECLLRQRLQGDNRGTWR